MADPSTVAQLVRTVLGGPHAEAAMKRQVLALAQQNLHAPEVPAALLEVLPRVADRESQSALLQLVCSLDTGRFPSLRPLHEALLAALGAEPERATRLVLLERLGRGLAADPLLLEPFVATVSRPGTSEPERAAAAEALARLPAPPPEVALAALGAARGAPSWLRESAVALALRTPQLTEPLVAALGELLVPASPGPLRVQILRHLAAARRLTPASLPALRELVTREAEPELRLQALDLLTRLTPWTGDTWQLLLHAAAADGDASVRARAVALQREAPELSPEALQQLAARLLEEGSPEVRLQILQLQKPGLRLPEVRLALARSFHDGAALLEERELQALTDLLAPYASRDAGLRDLLLSTVERLQRAASRGLLLSGLLPRLRVEEALPLLCRLFARERDEALRAQLLRALRPLSLARHPELRRVFIDELLEPGSQLRAECAGALGAIAEEDPEAVRALEEVLLTERERDLLRACLDGYLRPRVARRFDPLLAVVQNELVESGARQRCLEELVKLQLDEPQSRQLAEALAGVPAGLLRRPQ